MRRILLPTLALLVCAFPAVARADSIVYMKGAQVWVADTAGQNARAVTKYDYNWRWPSEADDGTIVSAGGPGHGDYGEAGSDLYAFHPDGNLAHGPIPTPGDYSTLACPTSAPSSVRVSPDASKIAYSNWLCSGDFTALWTPATATGLDWPRQNSGLGTEEYDDPYWTDSSHFLVSHVGTTLGYARWYVHDTAVDTSTAENGWAESDAADASSNAPDTTGEQAVMSRDGTRMVILEDDQADHIDSSVSIFRAWVYTVSGGALTWHCTIALDPAKTTQPFYASPSLSPDGTKLLWADDTGVELMSLGNVASACSGHSSPVLIVPGGWEPFYAKGNANQVGEAANPAQPGAPAAPPVPSPSPSPTPGPTPPQPQALQPVAGFRLATKHPRARHKLVFDARASHEAGGRIVSYRWKFGDGKSGSGRQVKHAYRKAGRYKVTLTVADAAGHKATRKLTIRVKR